MKETWTLGLKLALICALAAFALDRVAALTRAPIEEAKARATRQAVEAVIPAFDSLRVDTLPAGQCRYIGLKEGKENGLAFSVTTPMGYSGEIEFMLGVDRSNCVTGLRILSHAETPGLGAKYADPGLLDQFYAGHTLESRDWRVRGDGGDVDAITGATVTGRALADAIASSLAGLADEEESESP